MSVSLLSVDFDHYFQTRKNLSVSQFFSKRLEHTVLPPHQKAALATIQYVNLSKDMTDVQVLDTFWAGVMSVYALPFSLGKVACLIEFQKHGEPGPLRTEDQANNIFYVLSNEGEPLALMVSWKNKDRGWDVFPYKFSEHAMWGEGDRVFFDDTPSL